MKDNISKLKLIGYLKGASFFVPILTLYLLGHGVGLPEIVFIQTIYAIFVFLGEVPTGLMADKFGQKAAILFGYLLNTLALIILIIFPSTLGVYITYALIGFADSSLSGSEEALFYESAKQKDISKFKKDFSIYSSNEILGVVFSTLACGIVIGVFGEKTYVPLIIANMAAMFIAFLLALSLKSIKAEIKDKAKGASAFAILKQAIVLIRTNKIISTLTLVSILTLTGEYFLYSVYQPYFEAYQVDPFFLGAVLSIGALLNYFLKRYAYLLEKFLAFEKIILLINFLLGGGYIALALFVHPIFLVANVIFLRGMMGIDRPIVSDYVNEYTDSHIRATVLSGMSQIKFLFQIGARTILALLVGLISIQQTFLVQGIYLVIGASIAYYLLVKCGCTHKITKHQE